MNEKRSDFLRIFILGVNVSRILKNLQIFWSDLVAAIGYLETVDMD